MRIKVKDVIAWQSTLIGALFNAICIITKTWSGNVLQLTLASIMTIGFVSIGAYKMSIGALRRWKGESNEVK